MKTPPNDRFGTLYTGRYSLYRTAFTPVLHYKQTNVKCPTKLQFKRLAIIHDSIKQNASCN